jgi:hypothetical protein
LAHETNPTLGALRWTLRPVGAGLMLAGSGAVFLSGERAWPVANEWVVPALLLVAVATALATLRWKLNPLAWIALAAVVGALIPLR